MRYAVVSDIHGNLPALEAVLADARDAEAFLNLGDIVSGPLWPRETADWLMARGWPTIAGNHERQLLTRPRERQSASDRFAAEALTAHQWAWLAALPAQMSPQSGLHCVHGTPGDDLQYLLETVTPAGWRAASHEEIAQRLDGPLNVCSVSGGLLLCGHSHVPRVVAHGAWRIANPGSVGLQAYDDAHPWPHDIENGSPQARYARVDSEGWQVTLRCVDYDHAAAARRAEANGRCDWADALRSGRVGRREADGPAALQR